MYTSSSDYLWFKVKATSPRAVVLDIYKNYQKPVKDLYYKTLFLNVALGDYSYGYGAIFPHIC